MTMPTILGSKNAEFYNRPITARYKRKDAVELALAPQPNSFFEMLDVRKQSQDVDDLERRLKSREGAQLANVGISALITANFLYSAEQREESFVLATRADRVDRKDPDTVAKLLSAYVPAETMHDPEAFMHKQIAEELLPAYGEDFIGCRVDCSPLELPYKDAVNYITSRSINLNSCPHRYGFSLPGLKKGTVTIIDGKKKHTLADNVAFHSAADTNSGQLIFNYQLNIHPRKGLSFHHSEVKFNPKTKELDTHFHPEGILFLKLDEKKKLTGDAYTFAEGQLKPYELPVQLTEAFAPKTNGVSWLGNVGLQGYVGAIMLIPLASYVAHHQQFM